MLCSLLKRRDLGFLCRSVLGFLDRSISGAMGCFIGCFRVRDDRHPHRQRSQPHLVSESSRPKLNEVVTSSNRLSSLFSSQATNAQNRNKSVRFECDSDLSSRRGSSENSSQNLKKSDSPDNCPNAKPRIRSQYVYSVSNTVESDSQRNVMKEEDSSFLQLSRELRESMDHPENPTPESKEEVKECLSDRETKAEASLSAWLKPVRHAQDGNNHNLGDFSNRPRVTRTPMDRPIIGMVAAHWNEDDPSRISPKWWDGNGIPNSTNKYKEDQKVSWHATPFEERLEKALSEETVITQRKDIYGKPLAFDDNEESDTALSQLQSSHTKSVVTC